MRKKLKKILFVVLILFLALVVYFFIGEAPRTEKITWGVSFSQKHAEYLGLDWQETYLALLDDLKVKNIKLITHWDLIEPREGEYNFEDLDWQIDRAGEREAEITLVIGMKTGRWPECHLPNWAGDLEQKEREENILELIKKIVQRYRDRVSVRTWQVENEPFFPFGECPKIEKRFLQKEINLVKSLDSENRQILISDSGEFSFWIRVAKLGDIVSTTLHRRVWAKELKIYVTHYWFRPIYYWRRAQIINRFFDKEVICGELQAEPWCPQGIGDCGPKEQKKTMSLQFFQKNIEFAKKTGLKEFYLWGAEWWFWLREKQNDSQIWNEAKKLFLTHQT